MDDDALLLMFEQHQAAQGCTLNTVTERRITLRAMQRRIDRPFLEMTRHDLIGDLGRAALSPRTRQNYRSLFHTYFTWMQDEGFRLDNPAVRLPSIRVHKREANPVTTADIEYLLNSGIYGKTRMYVLLYSYQAFRAVEIAAVAGESIDWRLRRILSVEGKGGNEVWRPIHDLVWAELQKYPRTGHLFPSPKNPGEHVTRKNVSNVLGQAFKRAGIVGHVPHNLRAWHATTMLENGVDTTIAAASLRHSDLQSIPMYQRVPERLITDAMGVLPLVTVPQRSGRQRAA